MNAFNPIPKEQQRALRARLFFHLDGLALCGVVPVLDMSGVLEEALQTGGDVDEMALVFGANPGYLNVGLRMLCSQGILDAHLGEDKITYISIKKATSLIGPRSGISMSLAGTGWNTVSACGTVQMMPSGRTPCRPCVHCSTQWSNLVWTWSQRMLELRWSLELPSIWKVLWWHHGWCCWGQRLERRP